MFEMVLDKERNPLGVCFILSPIVERSAVLVGAIDREDHQSSAVGGGRCTQTPGGVSIVGKGS